MEVIRQYRGVPAAARGAVVAIGNFDGVHRGHQAVIGEARRIAAARGAPSAVMTFEPHPRRFFRPEDAPFELTPVRAKTRQIGVLGVDLLFLMRFDAEFAAIGAEDFAVRVLLEGIGARHLVVGHDFVFGRGRAGDAALLRRLAESRGVGVTVVEAVRHPGGDVYASTAIRNHLRAGRPVEAAELLGRLWEIEGEVVTGERRGREIGFPTANVEAGAYVQPALGVYATWAGITDDGNTDWHPAVANIGRRPTFGGDGVTIEVHLFDFFGELYGKVLRVAPVAFVRAERKFDGIEAIRRQIADDCRAARAILDAIPADDLRAPPGLVGAAAEWV